MEKVSLLPKNFLSSAGAVTSAYYVSLETRSIFLTSSSFLSKAHSGYGLLQHQRLSVSSWATVFCYCLTSLIVGCRLAVVACLPFRTLSALLYVAPFHYKGCTPCSFQEALLCPVLHSNVLFLTGGYTHDLLSLVCNVFESLILTENLVSLNEKPLAGS